MTTNLIPIEIMTPHIHLSAKHQELIFGREHRMEILKPRNGLQGQYVYKEQLRVLGKKKSTQSVPIYGPSWEHTQLELTETVARGLGLEVPERISGDIHLSGSCMLQGPAGVVELLEGVIIPKAHLHCSPDYAKRVGIKHGDSIKLCLSDDLRTTFPDVIVRVHPTYQLLLHLSLDGKHDVSLRAGATAQHVFS